MFYYIYICLLSVHIHLASPVPPSHPPTLFLATPPHLLLGLPYPVVGFAGYMLSSSCEYLLFIFCVNVLMIFAFKHELIAFDFFKYLSGAPHTLFCQYPEMGVVILWHGTAEIAAAVTSHAIRPATTNRGETAWDTSLGEQDYWSQLYSWGQ